MANLYVPIPDECEKCLKDETGCVKCPRSIKTKEQHVLVAIPRGLDYYDCPHHNGKKTLIVMADKLPAHELGHLERLF
jgi:hypothetical protein